MSQASQEQAVQKLARDLFIIVAEKFTPGIELSRSAFVQEISRVVVRLQRVIGKYRDDHGLSDVDVLEACRKVEQRFEATFLVPVELKCRISDVPGNLALLLRKIADEIQGDLIFINGGYPNSSGSADLMVIFGVERSRNLAEIVRRLADIPSGIIEADFSVELTTWDRVAANEEALANTVIPFRHRGNGRYRSIEQAIADRPGSLASELRRLAEYYSVKSILGYRLHNGSASISMQIEPAQKLRKVEG